MRRFVLFLVSVSFIFSTVSCNSGQSDMQAAIAATAEAAIATAATTAEIVESFDLNGVYDWISESDEHYLGQIDRIEIIDGKRALIKSSGLKAETNYEVKDGYFIFSVNVIGIEDDIKFKIADNRLEGFNKGSTGLFRKVDKSMVITGKFISDKSSGNKKIDYIVFKENSDAIISNFGWERCPIRYIVENGQVNLKNANVQIDVLLKIISEDELEGSDGDFAGRFVKEK